MIYSDSFRLNEKKQEVFSYLSKDYPYVCEDVTLDRVLGRSWHWHNALEIDYVYAGTMCIKIPGKSEEVHAGDVIFLNSRILHDARAREQSCSLYANLFEASFLGGSPASRIEEKFLSPLLTHPGLDIWVFRGNRPEDLPLIERVLALIAANQREDFDMELKVRSLLGEIWCLLLAATEEFRSQTRGQYRYERQNHSYDRVRSMMNYIHDHYMEPVQVADIASCAGVSPRECSRSFSSLVGQSPIQYLLSYRLEIAAGLLRTTRESILSISEGCGFSSSSYFSRHFKAVFGCTPMEYRQRAEKP